MPKSVKNNQTDSQSTSRRTFLRQSSAVVAGTALNSVIAAKAHAAGDETIKVGLIGCGGRGTGAVTQALNTKGPVKLWAMADVFKGKLKASLSALLKGQETRYDREKHQGFGSKIDVPPERRFVGFDAYKQAIDSGVDMVILTTPPHFRPMQFEYAVKQGKHVFMEKPVAVDGPGIRQLLAVNEEAKKRNLKVAVGLHYRHNRKFQETIKRLKKGAIGEIGLIRCYRNFSGLPVVHRQTEMTEMEYQLRNWNGFTWPSGDHIVEGHVHDLDVCNWLKGEHPVTAQGQGGQQVCIDSRYGDIYDHHFVEFTYSDGTKMFSQCRAIPGCWNNTSAHAHGTGGAADVCRGRIEGAEKWRFRDRAANPYQVEHDVLFDAIRTDKPHNEAEYGATSSMTAIMGRMATYSGKMLTWDQAINSELSLAPKCYAMDADPPIMPGEGGLYPCAMPGVTKAF